MSLEYHLLSSSFDLNWSIEVLEIPSKFLNLFVVASLPFLCPCLPKWLCALVLLLWNGSFVECGFVGQRNRMLLKFRAQDSVLHR